MSQNFQGLLLTKEDVSTKYETSKAEQRKRLFVATWLDLEIFILSKVNQRKINIIC